MVQNSWQYQGRQKHGEWGHGTAPHSAAEPSEADTRPAPDDAAMRATYVAYGAIAHLPRETFRVLESHLERGGLHSFQKAVAAYPATAHLDDESWRAHVTGDTLPSVGAARLRAALEITHAAATQGDINHGSMHFAALVRSTGVPKTMSAVATAADAGPAPAKAAKPVSAPRQNVDPDYATDLNGGHEGGLTTADRAVPPATLREQTLSSLTREQHASADRLTSAALYFHNKYPNDCSGFVRNLIENTVDPNMPHLQANAMDAYFKRSPDWEELTEDQAVALASRGQLVIASHPEVARSGHVAMVAPGPKGEYVGGTAVDGHPSHFYPRLISSASSSYPGTHSSGEKTVRDAWPASEVPSVTYWVHR